ncbi:MAG: MFS transporter [Clostridia bacterium]|nr:MFS transporter [Clostridia bacterium]
MADEKKKFNLKEFAGDFKTHWNKPKEGRYVPYKEYLSVFIGAGGDYALQRVLGKLSFGTGCFLVIFYYEIPVLTFSVIGAFFMVQGYFWSIINMMISDNLGFLPKKTEKLFYTLYLTFTALGLAFLIFDFSAILPFPRAMVDFVTSLPGLNLRATLKIFGAHWLVCGYGGARAIFIRKRWLPKLGRYKLFAYTNVIPSMILSILICWLPLYNKPLPERVWMLYLLFTLFGMFTYTGGAQAISSTISPDPHERMLVRAYPEKLSHLINSIVVASLFPVLASALTGDQTHINTYRYLIPIMTVFCSVIMFAGLGSIQERIPQPPIEKKKYIPFWDGINGVLRNKYRWIDAISGLIDALGNGGLAVQSIILIYTWRELGLLFTIITNLIAFMGNPGAFLSPWIRKRFQYKTLVIFKRLIFAAQCAGYILACWVFRDNYFMSGLVMLISLCIGDMLTSAVKLAEADMGVRLNDYQMYLSGERLENYAGVVGWFTSPFGALISLIIPIIFYRFGFTSDYDILFVDDIRTKCMIVGVAFDLVGHLLCCLPYLFFWDYTDEKHMKVVEALKERERIAQRADATEADIYGNLSADQTKAEAPEPAVKA